MRFQGRFLKYSNLEDEAELGVEVAGICANLDGPKRRDAEK